MKRLFVIFVVFFLFVNCARAQIPPPVELPIPNILQQTSVWCWVAVAQQIIHATRGADQTPPQCALVAIANDAHPSVCCDQSNPDCLRTGSFPQIAGLIAQFGGRTSNYALPADPMILYRTLASGRAIILHIKSGIISTHVVVLRGMSFMQTLFGVEPILHINDPMAYYTHPVFFKTLIPVWIDALVVN